MLRCSEFDIKTGRVLTDTNPETGVVEPRVRDIAHPGLEYWLACHGMDSQWWVGNYYDGVVDADRARLESEGKFLAFTNGSKGYFTDAVTLDLLVYGDKASQIEPFFAADKNSAHNRVAYGSLGVSDGESSIEISNSPKQENSIAPQSATGVRFLVIDDEHRSHGDIPLYDRQGREIPQEDIEKLYDKMGDGTLLTSSRVLQHLYTPEELSSIISRALNRSLNREDTDTVGRALDAALAGDREKPDAELVERLQQQFVQTGSTQCEWVPEMVSDQLDRAIARAADKVVTQFRALTPELPGQMKGTMGTSQWCHRLGVDFIVSLNDIKGDDGRLSTPGIHEVDRFWVNRKTDATYSTQRVGPQVKGCIPESTLYELNPKIQEKQEEFQRIVEDPQKLAAYYVEKVDKRLAHLEELDLEKGEDWVRDVLAADPVGWTVGLTASNNVLEGFIRKQRLDLAINGIEVPAATAQHHSQLKPWEVCNKDLPHGALVAYYRSPFPNVGAAAIGINNLEALREADPEAFNKEGVAYLNPWTAKNIAITDFDADKNGYFVGYIQKDENLPQTLREQLEIYSDLPPAAQYEHARAWFDEQIALIQHSPEAALFERADYPKVVEEVVQLNAPDKKPIEVSKQKKVKHAWEMDNEPHTEATWRGWEITANNPTGMVANAGMTLQSLALQTVYMPEERREPLLLAISEHFQELKERLDAVNIVKQLEDKLPTASPSEARSLQKQLDKARDKQLVIPSDEELQTQGFPAYGFEARIREIALLSDKVQELPEDSPERKEVVETGLSKVNSLLKDVVDGPNAVNLQTAVDVAKSSRGIDLKVQTLTESLAYQEHALRKSQKDPKIYTKGNSLPTNTQEPIGWAVEAANAAYKDTHLVNRLNQEFFGLMPKVATAAQEQRAVEIATHYKALISAASHQKEIEKSYAARQPSLQLTTPTGNSVRIDRLCDADPAGQLPIWRASGTHEGHTIKIVPREKKDISGFEPEPLMVLLSYPTESGDLTTQAIGVISEEQASQHKLEERIARNGSIEVQNPTLEIQPPLQLTSTAEVLKAQANKYLQEAVAAIPEEERYAYASALWHRSDTMEMVLKAFTPEICQCLEQPQTMRIMGIGRESNEAGRSLNGEYEITAIRREYTTEQQEQRTIDGLAINIDGEYRYFGAFDAKSLRFPEGNKAIATIETPPSPTLEVTLADGREFKVERLDQGYFKDQLLENFPAQLEIKPVKGELQVGFRHPDDGQTYPIGVMASKSRSLGSGAEKSVSEPRPISRQDPISSKNPMQVEATLNRGYANYALASIDPAKQNEGPESPPTRLLALEDRVEEIILASTSKGHQLVIVGAQEFDSKDQRYWHDPGALQFSKVGTQGFAWLVDRDEPICIGRLDPPSQQLIEDIGYKHGRDFFEEDVSIPVTLHTAPASLAQDDSSARYCPSIHDLRMWNMAIAKIDTPDQAVKESWVRSIAHQLLQGSPQSDVPKLERSPEFRNPTVSLTESEYGLMQRDMKVLGLEINQPFTQPKTEAALEQ